MSFLELATTRYSLRNYSPRAVEREKLDYILQAAQIAPSAVNYQPWSFVVITQAEMMVQVHACYHRDWFKTAPACILVLGNQEQSWKRADGKDFCDVDVAIAIDHITLAATEQGLGTCWVCNFDVEKTKALFELPPHIEPIAFIPIGYASEDAVIPEKKRKNLNEIVRWVE